MYVCVLIRVYLYVCMHVYIYMCIYMCSIYMFMRRVCIHTRIPSFSELRFYVVYNIANRPFLGRGFNHAYIWMVYCVLYVIWNTYCFNVFYWIYGIRIVLLVFTWYVEYVLSACIFLSCFTYLCLVRNDLINMFKQTNKQMKWRTNCQFIFDNMKRWYANLYRKRKSTDWHEIADLCQEYLAKTGGWKLNINTAANKTNKMIQ